MQRTERMAGGCVKEGKAFWSCGCVLVFEWIWVSPDGFHFNLHPQLILQRKRLKIR